MTHNIKNSCEIILAFRTFDDGDACCLETEIHGTVEKASHLPWFYEFGVYQVKRLDLETDTVEDITETIGKAYVEYALAKGDIQDHHWPMYVSQEQIDAALEADREVARGAKPFSAKTNGPLSVRNGSVVG